MISDNIVNEYVPMKSKTDSFYIELEYHFPKYHIITWKIF
jgi:hypothetical protein